LAQAIWTLRDDPARALSLAEEAKAAISANALGADAALLKRIDRWLNIVRAERSARR
jgi:hypothetical protein